MKKPIAMRMNAEQFESIKGVLEENGVEELEHNSYYEYSFINNLKQYNQANTVYFEDNKNDYELHEEFNAKTFLNSLGIEYNESEPTTSIARFNVDKEINALMEASKRQGLKAIVSFELL